MFDAIVLEKPLDFGMTQKEFLDLLGIFKSDVELVTLRADGESSYAYGIVTFDAIENKIDTGKGETHLEEEISKILKDKNLENKDQTYNILGLECIITRDLDSVFEMIGTKYILPNVKNVIEAHRAWKKEDTEDTKNAFNKALDFALQESDKFGDEVVSACVILSRYNPSMIFDRYRDHATKERPRTKISKEKLMNALKLKVEQSVARLHVNDKEEE